MVCLLDLPQEILDNIFDSIAKELPISQVLSCRQVNDSFKSAIWMSLLRTSRLLPQSGTWHDKIIYPCYICPIPLVAEALRYQVDHRPMLSGVRRVVDAVVLGVLQIPGALPQIHAEQIRQQLYEAIVRHYGTCGVRNGLSHSLAQTIDTPISSIDLISAVACLGLVDHLRSLLHADVDSTKPSKLLGTPCYATCLTNQAECLELLYQHQRRRHIPNEERHELLFKASIYNSVAAIRWLTTLPDQPGAWSTMTDRARENLIGEVCLRGHLETLHLLRAKFFNQLDPTHYNFIDESFLALGQAARGGKCEIIKYFATLGADLNYRHASRTLLAEAILSNHPRTLQTLLDLGADPNQIDRASSKRPLGLAYRKENAKAIEIILNANGHE